MDRRRTPNSVKLKIVLAYMFGEDKRMSAVSAATGQTWSTCYRVVQEHIRNLNNPE